MRQTIKCLFILKHSSESSLNLYCFGVWINGCIYSIIQISKYQNIGFHIQFNINC